jgi:hypothetical protein
LGQASKALKNEISIKLLILQKKFGEPFSDEDSDKPYAERD